MKKNLLLFILIVFIFSFSTVCFAGNNTYNLPLPTEIDDNPYYVILKNNDGSFNLHTFTSLPGNCEENDYEGCHHVILGSGPKYVFHPGDSSWTFQGNYLQCILSCSVPTHWNGELYNRQILYSNFDIIDYSGNVLFSNTPLYITPDEVVDDSPTLSGIGKFFDSLFDKLSSLFGSVIDYIKGIPNAIAYLFTNLGNLLSNLLNSIIDYIKGIPSAIAYLFTNLGDLLSNLFNSAIDYIKAIPQSTVDLFSTLFEYLFVPSDNLFNDFETLIKEKFGIFFQLKQLTLDLTTLDSSEVAPSFKITYAGHTLNIIDFSMFAQYRSLIHNIIILISGFFFVKWLIVSAPSIVMGQTVSEGSENS